MRRGPRRLFLGVQWEAGSWDDLPPLCACLLERTGSAPLHWNFPAVPSDSLKKTRSWLEKTLRPRLEAGTDVVAPMGFAGACHPFLNLDELEKEIAWTRRNPWDTGVADLLGARPSVLIPRMADTTREDALKLYADNGYTTLGLCGAGTLSWFALGGLSCFTCTRLRVSEGVPSPFSARFRELTAARGDLFLIIDLAGASLEKLQELLDSFLVPLLDPDRTAAALLGAPPPRVPPRADVLRTIDWSPFPAPLLRRKLTAATALARRKRKKSDDYRELLEILSSAADRPAEKPAAAGAPRVGTRLVAQMLGEVVLAGNVFDVKLEGGRFCGITRAGRPLLPVRPAASYLRAGGRTWPFRTRNSFSFEGDGGTGLREELAIESADGSALAIEYSFREDCPMLEIRAEVSWPVVDGPLAVDEHVPFVVSLSELRRGEDPVVEAEAPNGGSHATRISGDQWIVVPGALHRISLPGGSALVLRSTAENDRGWNAVSFRVVRDRRKRILEANPFGGWAPVAAQALSGKKETFALLVGLEDAAAPTRKRR